MEQDKITFKPNTGKVVIQILKEKKLKDGEQRPVTSHGVVIATGGEAPWKDGDLVMFNRWQALEFTKEGQKYLLLKHEDVLLIES